MLVALTGGIGSGKSRAGEIFSELGAIVVDSDQLARDVIERGQPAFDKVVAEFGDGILKDGAIERRALGEIVFRDESARLRLERILHPAIREAFQKIASTAPAHSVVINQIPLLAETQGQRNFDAVIVVTAPLEKRIERLKVRGMYQSDIEARIAAQVDDDERVKLANYIIDNSHDERELRTQVEKIYADLVRKA